MTKDELLKQRELAHGLISINPNFDINNREQLSQIYTPGVSTICKEVEHHPSMVKTLTSVGNSIAVITDGTAVLGLGNIGTLAGYPIVEAKALVYKDLAGVNAIPLCVDQIGCNELIKTIKNISSSFSGIHLEDIKAPECFYIEEELKKTLNIPVYHDDQHGTAIAVLGALYNASKVVNKDFSKLKVLILGAGASGIATAKLLLKAGIEDIILVDKNGALVSGDETLNAPQKEMAKITNKELKKGTLEEVIKGRDVFIGLSEGNLVTKEMVESMDDDPIIFALANPTPEIKPEIAKEAGARVIATGGPSYPNQINNILVFPGLFKGLLEAKATDVTYDVMIAVSKKLASLVENPTAEKIIPGVFDGDIVKSVSETVVKNIEN
ncbi:NADP-dependent malic enzyme [Clostridium perfringens]|uniref:NAD(P)-dependent malic enzyme n=1 Tax=Clostridium perfringens TaxID=1502 RepID=UPI0028E1810A|nr:NADP-dependent malic enzyme [Clostridium perfringens]MDT9337406.1 NADP-dependent malic enzyme [Clostridium perfringens]MDT9345103.1 NADP-dependent malic enzyme [Clostridium perfringens]MDT9348346.1 NADP-dependent malic enzyme [Clostridium perfringens]MDT9354189.1 NADP-dependent malic enzyme [Clostridium perfringens]